MLTIAPPPAGASPAAAPTAAAPTGRCGSITEAIGRLPKPSWFESFAGDTDDGAAGFTWPPRLGGACTIRSTRLGYVDDGVEVVEVGCRDEDPRMPERTGFAGTLYRRDGQGCLTELATLGGPHWFAADTGDGGELPHQLVVEAVRYRGDHESQMVPSVLTLTGARYDSLGEPVDPQGPYPTLAAYCTTTKATCAPAKAAQVDGPLTPVAGGRDGLEVALVTVEQGAEVRFDLAIKGEFIDDDDNEKVGWQVIADVARAAKGTALPIFNFAVTDTQNHEHLTLVATEGIGAAARLRQAGCSWRGDSALHCVRDRR
ncbi:MAG: hypothetical protein R2939_23140 [Kofleriaceae bacterium]